MQRIKKILRQLLGCIPYVRFQEERYKDLQMVGNEFGHQPGHYYSTIPSPSDIERVYPLKRLNTELPGIDFSKDKQFQLLTKFLLYYHEFLYSNSMLDQELWRYSELGAYYRFADVVML